MPSRGPMLALVIVLAADAVAPAPAAADEARTPTAKECVADVSSAYGEDGRKFTYTLNFQNDCDRPIACVVDTYVVGARGPSQGHATLKFAAKAQESAKASFTMRVKASGGMALSSRDCRFL